MFIPSVFYPFLIKSYTLYTQLTNKFVDCIGKLSLAYDAIYGQTIYAFYDGYLQPVLYKPLNKGAKPTLFYDADYMLFYPNAVQDPMNHRHSSLPILSLEIIDSNENVAHDLTDFIEKIRYIGYDGCSKPTLSSIVMIWATISNNFPDPLKHRVRYIDSSGDMFEKGFDGNL
jgi:hypothetical protein